MAEPGRQRSQGEAGTAAVEAVVVGAGGFGREALDVIEAHNSAYPQAAITVLGIADDAPSTTNLDRLEARGYVYLGTISDVINAHRSIDYVLGVGSPAARTAIDVRLTVAGWHPVTIIHPAAVLGSMTQIGEGAIICAGVNVSTNVTLGRHVHLNPNATLGHDAALGDHVSVNPSAVISGEVTIGPGTLIGAGAIILQQLTVGAKSTIGAGSVVTKPVPDNVTVKGIPGVWE